MRKVLIIGATSAIAQATARLYAGAGDELFIVARDETKLLAVAEDLRVRGASAVHTTVLDVLEFERHQEVITAATQALNTIDIALIAHGTLPDQKKCEQSLQYLLKEMETNALSTISLLTILADMFEQRASGTIAVISSVAGDRGRQSNYVYGAAKAAVTIFMQGLRNRLAPAGVNVVTIKPGFVDTPMTEDFTKGLLWTSPHKVALCIHKAIAKRKDLVYVPFFWRPIMFLVRAIPEKIFKRMRL
jgi:short-subunit dehydrogenase